MSKQIAIIGAGPGGLSSAILLAAAGFKVTVFEKMAAVGGRTSSIEEEGFRFDLGPTFFFVPENPG
jgi:phytoene desaturase